MADQKITQLTAISALTVDDLFVMVDAPGGTPQTKKISYADLLTELTSSGMPRFIEEVAPSGISTFTFSSLGSYTHLKLIYTARGTQSATSTSATVIVNADTGSNYDEQRIVGLNTTATTDNDVAQTSWVDLIRVSGATAPANSCGSGELLFNDYRGTTFQKQGTGLSSWKVGTGAGALAVQMRAFSWRSTAAITSITVTLTSGTFVAGSKFSLYGMR